jgi:transcriptional regulator with XRE-family HTH domain
VLTQIRQANSISGMAISDKIESLCRARGWKVSDLADETGVPVQRFSDWKHKPNRAPTLPQLLRVARTLGVTVDYLIDPTRVESEPGPTDDEIRLLWSLRSLGVTPQEALAKVAGRSPSVARPLGGGAVTPGPGGNGNPDPVTRRSDRR